MAIVHIDQRRPFTIEESGDTDALPARLYRRLASNVNNLITHVARPPQILQFWPGGIGVSSTGETYLAQWPRRDIPRYYKEIRFVVGSIQTVGNGIPPQTVTLRLYAYQGLFLTEESGTQIGVVSVTVDQGLGNGHAFRAGTLDLRRRLDRNLHLVLTGQANDPGAAATVYTLKAWARVA